MPQRNPDFFLVGAPKCGTTAMYAYLREHPDIFMAQKERHFFGADLRPEGYTGPHVHDVDWYQSFFEEVGGEQRVGEASVWYLYSTQAAKEIKAFAPEADIIIMLRNPIDMMYSLYNMFIWVHDVTPGGVLNEATHEALTFEDALANQAERKAAFQGNYHEDYLKGKRELRLFHTDAARYTAQVKRYFDTFGRDKVHVIIYDDLKADTALAYRETLAFLGVDTAYQPDFKVMNSNRQIRNPKLHKMLFRNHESFGLLRKMGKMLLPQKARRGLHRTMMNMNVEHTSRPKMQEATRRWLEDTFRDEVAQLGELLEKDLVSRWYATSPMPAKP